MGCALSSNIFRFYQDCETKKWVAEKVISVATKKVENWWVGLTDMPGKKYQIRVIIFNDNEFVKKLVN